MEENAGPQPFRFRSPQQEQIYRRLLSIGRGPAAFYRDICRIMAEEPQLESASHLVSHLLREIESALRDALEPIGAWQANVSHEEEILQILRALGIPDDDPFAQAWLSLTGRGNAYGLAARAHRDSLAPPRPNDAGFREFVGQFELVLGAVLARMDARFADFFARVDQVLALPGSPEARLGQLENALPDNPIVTGYLLEQIVALGDPAWLDALEARGYFRHPPAADRSQDEDGGTESIRYPHWPHSQFLARMARDHREDQTVESITRIALGIPETDNAAVNEDLLVVALHLPPSHGARLGPRLGSAVESASSGFFPEHVAEFVIRLLNGGEPEAAFTLARELLAVNAVEVSPLELGGEVLRFSPDVHGLFADWMYERVVDRLAPALLAAQEEAALELLCDLLDDANAKARGADDRGEPVDYSIYWLPDLDEDDETGRIVAGVRGVLVRALRNAIHQLAARDPRSQAPRMIEVLRRRSWRIYRRLELDLVRSFADDVPDLVEQRLTDRELLNIEPPLPEYQALARARFGSLPASTQVQVLDAIEEGLGRERLEEEFRRSEIEPTEEGMDREARRLRWKRLGPIRGLLPAHVRDRFDALVAEFGDPVERESRLTRPMASFIGPTSPVSTADLSRMADEEIVGFLASWVPPGGFGAPTREGLGRAITGVVRQEPARFSSGARSFVGLDPTYVRATIAGLRESLATGAELNWEAVLDLCSWVVEQPREIESRDESDEDADPSWGWARQEIARLLAYGLSPGQIEIPFALRHHVWRVLDPLLSDSDPTPEDEARYGGPDTNPLEYGLNTVRASALETAIRYAAWVRTHATDGAAVGKEWPGFSEAPEVAEALESRLDPKRDPSAAVRAVYGRFLPWLIDFDADWVQTHLGQIFPADPDLAALRDAAWAAYAAANAASRRTFGLIQNEYRRAVAVLPEGAPRWSWQGLDDPNAKLGEHLATACAWGWIELENGGGLLGPFYRRASPGERAHVAEWIGRELQRVLARVGAPEIARLAALWESRIGEAEAAEDRAPYREEMSAFGWWFISGRFDDAWAVEQLRRVVRFGATPDFLYRVFARLAALAEQMPRATVECVGLLLEREDVSDWKLSSSLNEIDAILTVATSAGDDEAQRLASDSANRLVARGFVAFRELLGRKDHDSGADADERHR